MLSVEHLSKTFRSGFFSHSDIHAVRDVSFHLKGEEILGILGESGCGKTTLGKMLVRLLDPTSGTITVGNTTITRLHGKALYRFWPRLQMVFQDPRASLNPRMKIIDSLLEGLKISGKITDEKAEIHGILKKLNIREEILYRYPHEVSGGEIQRIVIARALSAKPALIVADEPTSNLDLSVQAQILNLLKSLHHEYSVPCILISHDIDIVRWMCDRVAVMFKGRIIEEGNVDEVLHVPLHPYTRALIGTQKNDDPIPDTLVSHEQFHKPVIPGCPYADRCRYVIDQCSKHESPLTGNGHRVACHRMTICDN
jgi:peptide/nickel transport system ATP-binding protein